MKLLDLSNIAIKIFCGSCEPNIPFEKQQEKWLSTFLEFLKKVEAEYSERFGHETVIGVDYKGADGYFRKDFYPEYKGDRKAKRSKNEYDLSGLYRFLNVFVPELKANSPLKVMEIDRLECDDIIAVLCEMYRASGEGQHLIISADKDLHNLAVKGSNVYFLKDVKDSKDDIKTYEVKQLEDDVKKIELGHILKGDVVDCITSVKDNNRVNFTDEFKEFTRDYSTVFTNDLKGTKYEFSYNHKLTEDVDHFETIYNMQSATIKFDLWKHSKIRLLKDYQNELSEKIIDSPLQKAFGELNVNKTNYKKLVKDGAIDKEVITEEMLIDYLSDVSKQKETTKEIERLDKVGVYVQEKFGDKAIEKFVEEYFSKVRDQDPQKLLETMLDNNLKSLRIFERNKRLILFKYLPEKYRLAVEESYKNYVVEGNVETFKDLLQNYNIGYELLSDLSLVFKGSMSKKDVEAVSKQEKIEELF